MFYQSSPICDFFFSSSKCMTYTQMNQVLMHFPSNWHPQTNWFVQLSEPSLAEHEHVQAEASVGHEALQTAHGASQGDVLQAATSSSPTEPLTLELICQVIRGRTHPPKSHYQYFASTVKAPVFSTLNSAISNFQTWFVRTVMEVLKYCWM